MKISAIQRTMCMLGAAFAARGETDLPESWAETGLCALTVELVEPSMQVNCFSDCESVRLYEIRFLREAGANPRGTIIGSGGLLFEAVRVEYVCQDSESDVVLIKAAFGTTDGLDHPEIRAIAVGAPVAVHAYACPARIVDVEMISLGPTHVPAVLWIPRDNQRTCVTLLDTSTFDARPASKALWQHQLTGDFLDVKGESLCFSGRILSGVCMDDVKPPPGDNATSRYYACFNDSRFALLRSTSNRENRFDYFLFTRPTGKWNTFSIKGTEHHVVHMGKWIACRIGWKIPAGKPYDIVWTGEWVLINLETLAQHSFFLQKGSEVYMIRDNYLFAQSGPELLCIPMGPEGEVKTDQTVVLLSDLDFVRNVKALLWAPKHESDWLEPPNIVLREHEIPLEEGRQP